MSVSKISIPALLALGAFALPPAVAQEQLVAPPTVSSEELPPTPSASEASREPEAAKVAPEQVSPVAATAPAAGEIRVRAEHQEGGDGHYRASGFVDLSAGGMRIQCDEVDIYETDRPDGSKAQKIVASGNVVFLRGEERLAGDRLEMDAETGRGTMDNAAGYVQPGVFVEARKIERQGEMLYRIEGGTFTACAQPNPRWRFSLRSANLKLEDKVVARSVVLRVKSVPVFWAPILSYPLDSAGRSTGFLFPHIGNSNVKGRNVGGGFFWAMGRSYDQTFYADHFAKVGYGFGHEFRYAGPSPSRAVFSTYVYNPKSSEERDWDIQWNAVKVLPGNVKATINVKQFSRLAFERLYQQGFNRQTTRTQRSLVSLQKIFPVGTLQVLADRTDNYFGETTQRKQKLPEISFRQYPKKIGRTGLVFGYDILAGSFGSGEAESLQSFRRLDIAPQVSRPFRGTFVEFNPRMLYRFTRYSSTYGKDDAGATMMTLDGPPLNRTIFETGIDLRGPNFSRVFTSPSGFYSDKLKHVIGPEVSFTYSTPVDDFDSIPKYDGTDWLVGTSKIDYGITQQLFARRRAVNGKLVPYEFLSWRIYQTYYLKLPDGDNGYDPNYSSSAFGPGFAPAHRSSLMSRLRFRPRPAWAADVNVEYDANYGDIRSLGFATTFGGERGALQAGWTQMKDLEKQAVQSSTIRGTARLAKLPGGFTLEGGVDYDFEREELYHANAKLKWDVQCCGFVTEVVRSNYGGFEDWAWRFSLNLANVGSMGSFLGPDAQQRQGALGGQR